MFEIWSGDSPWRGLQAAQIISQVLVKKARPEISFHIPDEMRKLMVRAWAHKPGDRPSFKEIAAAVRVSTPRGTATESWGDSTGGSPTNTLAAFRHALAMGRKCVEVRSAVRRSAP